MERALCWIRRDIRLDDHHALAEATRQAGEVVVLFVFDSLILGALQDADDKRVSFIYDSLKELQTKLQSHGSDLVVRYGNPVEIVPALAAELGVQAVFWNGDADPYAITRDALVQKSLKELGISSHRYKDHVVFSGREIRNQSGAPFRVFTPYSKAWLAALGERELQDFAPETSKLMAREQLLARTNLEFPSLQSMGFEPVDCGVPTGSSGAMAMLDATEKKLSNYKELRDRMDLDATSRLSVHLRHGTISIRECIRRAQSRSDVGASKWLSELIWREFYHMLLEEFPETVTDDFRPEFRGMTWPGQLDHFELWKEGNTGYPIVDAAMRCLRHTGWMHNRARMVVAMFLTKDLLLDWRLGEAHFARYLLDYELASNIGGWQWSASTGADAQPYFRIFNPILQSRKFDPDAEFIRTWCPELAGFEVELQHWPHDATPEQQSRAGCQLGKDYPHPIVDHGVQRDRAIELLGRYSKRG